MSSLDNTWRIWNAAVMDITTCVLWTFRDDHLVPGMHAIAVHNRLSRQNHYCMYGEAIVTGLPVCESTELDGVPFSIETQYISSHNIFVCRSYRQQPSTLSPQQQRIAELLLADVTIAEISRKLNVSESTVQSHLSAMRERHACRTNWGLVAKLLDK